MARREDIDNAIWGDPTFEALSADAKLLYLWSFTNPYCNMAGLYKASSDRMVRDTGLPPMRNRRAFDELAEARLLVRGGEWLWVRARVKYLRTKSPNMAASIVGDVGQLAPDDPLRAAFVTEYGTWPWLVDKGGEGWSALCEGTNHDLALQKETTEGSIDPPGQGKGNGSLSSITPTEDKDDLDAPERIFNHWRDALSPGARFTDERRTKVRARLKHYAPERILRAVDGCAASSFHVDNNHIDLKLICRSDEQLERFESLPLKGDGGMRNRDGTKTTVGNVASKRSVCRRCATRLSEYQANTQSGLCDPCYEAHVEKLTGQESA